MARISLIFLAAVAAKSAIAAQAAYHQCGGINWTGETSCVDGWECTSQNPYYYQCVQGTATATGAASTSSAASVVATTSVHATSSHAAAPSSVGTSAALSSVGTSAALSSVGTSAAPSSVETSAAPATTSKAVETSSKPVAVQPESATSSSEAITSAAATTLATSTKAASSSSSVAGTSSASAAQSSSSGDPNALAGAAADGTSGSGTTTRYWDCCKPSCAWPGKASVSSAVDTCDASGNVITDSNTASGCSSGTAYMCGDQTPFEVNSTMAYGFAAVNIAGGTESSWCCGCYELTFTSGTVEGKKMIVQATNTGGDLNSNQFDLAIPGGGVGLFNGCSTQYGTSWGSTYGGVSSASDCSSLPTALQAGCNFRFGWFAAADNPSVDWKSVQCPAELIAKSGCARE